MEQSYLKKVKLGGYKSVQETEIDFQPGLNIIIGGNGSGKTNFLKFLYQAIEMYYGELGQNFSIDLEGISESLKEVRIRIKSDVDKSREVIQKVDAELYIDNKSIKRINRDLRFDFGITSLSEFKGELYDRKIEWRGKLVPFSLPQDILFFSRSEQIKLQILGEKEDSTISFDYFKSLFSDLPNRILKKVGSFSLNYLTIGKNNIEIINKAEFIKEIDSLIEVLRINLKKFSPIEDIRFNENINIYLSSHELIYDNLLIECKINSNWYPFKNLSDGSQRILNIINEVIFFDNVILLEEPELGIHPHQLHLLMQFLKEQSESKQIILTTHSPQVLNILNKDELDRIIICEMTDKGTKLRHLTQKQKAKAKRYIEDEAFLSDYWIYSDLEPQTT